MSRPAILVENVTVRFRPYIDKKPTLRRSIANLRTRAVEEVVALDDVFRVEKGEAFGIIGRNGAARKHAPASDGPHSATQLGQGRGERASPTLLQLGWG